MKNRLRYILLATGVMLFWLVIRHLGARDLLAAFAGVRPAWICAGIGAYFVCVAIRSFKWYYLFMHLDYRMPFGRFYGLYLINTLAGILTPSRSGEALFPLLLKRYCDVSVSRVLSFIFVDRLFDLVFFIFLMGFSLLFVRRYLSIDSVMFNVLIVSLTVLIALVALLILFLLLRDKSLAVVARVTGNSAVKRWRFLNHSVERVSGALETFNSGVDRFRRPGIYAVLSACTLVAWCGEIVTYFLMARSVIDIPLTVFVPCYVISAGVALASFIPTGIGSGTISLVYLFSVFGFSKAKAAAISIMGLVVPLFSLAIVALVVYLTVVRRTGNKTYTSVSQAKGKRQ